MITKDEAIARQLSNALNVRRIWGDVIFNVKEYGALGDGYTDDRNAIQETLNIAHASGGGIVYLPKGIYRISNYLQVKANTKVMMDDNAVIQRAGSFYRMILNGVEGQSDYSYGYDGDGNLMFEGGTYDLNVDEFPPPAMDEYGPICFGLHHADGIYVKNIRITNGMNNHYFDIAGCRNVHISDCIFDNMQAYGSSNYEVIQIAPSTPGGFPPFGGYDFTPCENVVVENCVFENVDQAVGNHANIINNGEIVRDKNIIINNNIIRNTRWQAIRVQAFENVVVTNNLIENVSSATGLFCYSSENVTIENNIIRNVNNHGIACWSAGGYFPTNIRVVGNIIQGCGGRFISANIIESEIRNNNCVDCGYDGIELNQSKTVVIEGNMLIDVAEDRNAFDIVNSEDITIKNNIARNKNKGNMLRGVFSRSGNSGLFVSDNSFENVDTEMNTLPTDSVSGISIKEMMLTSALNASSGSITLMDDISKFRYVVIATGDVGSGQLRHSFARGWSLSGFRPGNDYINVSTSNGKFIASIDDERTITIITADDPLRYVIGVK